MIAVEDTVKEKFNKIQELVDNIAYSLDDAYEIGETLIEDNLNTWKTSVLRSLPNGCSLKFRTDVEAMLENFKSIY
jgi:hypothetical protein